MTASDGAGAARDRYSFFLSYAHTPPVSDGDEDADHWVGVFFRDLSRAVAQLTGRRATGFVDREMAPGSNWNDYLLSALGEAKVFVPLYSPRYFASTAAGREWTAFRTRLRRAGVPEPDRQYLPVLWIPLPPGYPLPEGVRQAQYLGHHADYRRNGLQALCRLPRFRETYEQVVFSLAERIVDIAADVPVARSVVPGVADDELEFPRGRVDPPFVIAVAAATGAATAPAGHYGDAPTDWRPFGLDEKMALTSYAATIAERFQFSPIVTGLDQAAGPLASAPGIVLIDPWLTDEEHAAVLRAVAQLPIWTLPVVVAAGDDPRHTAAGEQRTARIMRALADIRPVGTEAARRAASGIDSLDRFDSLFPILVNDAARRYLLDAEVYPPRGASRGLRTRPSTSDRSGKQSDD